jgi:hypothetical protein
VLLVLQFVNYAIKITPPRFFTRNKFQEERKKFQENPKIRRSSCPKIFNHQKPHKKPESS